MDGNNTEKCGGFVGWKKAAASITFNDSLFDTNEVSIKASGSKTFVVGGEASDAWFTLDGRRLNGTPTKGGLYINNGRKVVVK